MADPHVRSVGWVKDFDGRTLYVGIDYDLATVGDYRFNRDQLEELAQLLVSATWQAASCELALEIEARDT